MSDNDSMENRAGGPMNRLDAYSCPLAGRNVVSAGAGTGKTYNIQILLLREVLSGVPIGKILVVTFTNLATNELKERLHSVLRKALEVARKARASASLLSDDAWQGDKAALQTLPCLRRMVAEGGDEALEKAAERLRIALADFDSAPISTIHSFCSRVLKDNAFESNTQYGLELRSSCQAQMKALCADFFRGFLAKGSGSCRRATALQLAKLTPESILADLKTLFQNPGVPVNWGAGVEEDEEANWKAVGEIEQSGVWEEFGKAVADMRKEDAPALRQRCEELKFKSCVCNFLTEENIAFCQKLDKEDALIWYYGVVGGLLGEKYDVQSHGVKKSIPVSMNVPFGSKEEKDIKCFAKPTKDVPVEKVWDFLKEENVFAKVIRAYLHVWLLQLDDKTPSIRQLLDRYRRILLREACRHVQEHLELLKARDGYMTYDDLLLRLKAQLSGDSENARRLCQAIQERFTCVMIDEFQDTDASQSAVFDALFQGTGDGTDQEGHPRTLFMIGDEKQSIYRFRGGDVENFRAHLRPGERNGVACYTLDRNFRSSADFIAAVNEVRGNHEADFFAPAKIAFPEILPGDDAGKKMLLEGGADGEMAPVKDSRLLSLRLLEKDEGVYECLSDEIRSMIDSGVRLAPPKRDGGENEPGHRPLRLRDIAVLVRKSTGVDDLRKKLMDKGIPSVYMQGRSVFKAKEGGLLYTLMDAVLEPGEQSKALLLLSTPFFGLSAETLEAARNSAALADFQMYLQELNRLWQSRDVHQMLMSFLNTGVKKMLGETPDGLADGVTPAQTLCRAAGDGQALARLRQLGEVLLSVEIEQHLGGAAMLLFLDGKLRGNAQKSYSDGDKEKNNTVDEDANDDEEYPMHLTTQEDAVRIMTIHKSKGLQFPVVFVPGFSDGKRRSEHIYHDAQSRRMVNMDTADASIAAGCDLDAQAEERRLLYVAITRAEYLCRFISKKPGENKSVSEAMLPECPVLSFVPADLPMKQPEPHTPRAERFGLRDGDLRPGWATTSFSSISKGVGEARSTSVQEADAQSVAEGDDGAEEDGAAAAAAGAMRADAARIPFEQRQPIFRFPGGKRTGTCWHGIFEQLDFQAWSPDAETSAAESSWKEVVTTLEHYDQLGRSGGLKEERLEAFRRMLSALCNAPVPFLERTERFRGGDGVAAAAPKEAFRLCQVPAGQTRREFGFTYRIRKGVDAESLRRWLAADGIAVPADWSHAIGEAALTGSIDMLLQNSADGLFYILDWKTNIINARAEDFDAAGVQAEADRHFYPLQCVIYALAFCQYYRQWRHGNEAASPEQRAGQLREAYEHFGGCADVFVRGVESQGSACVCPVTPSLELLLKLDECIGVAFGGADDGQERK